MLGDAEERLQAAFVMEVLLFLAMSALIGFVINGIAARRLNALILPAAALILAACVFGYSGYLARAVRFDYVSNGGYMLVFNAACYCLAFGVGGAGWAMSKTLQPALMISALASTLLVASAPLWGLMIACPVVGACP